MRAQVCALHKKSLPANSLQKAAQVGALLRRSRMFIAFANKNMALLLERHVVSRDEL